MQLPALRQREDADFMKLLCFLLKLLIVFVVALSLGIIENPSDHVDTSLREDKGSHPIVRSSYMVSIEGLNLEDVDLIEQLNYILERQQNYYKMLEEAQSIAQ